MKANRKHALTAPAQPMTLLVRCGCLICGADVEARVGMATVGGCCPNCGSYALDCSPFGTALAGERT